MQTSSVQTPSWVLKRYQCLGILVAICLVSPALWIGLQLDDYFHWSLVTQQPLLPATTDQAGVYGLFSFLDGNPERTHQLMDLGMLPWWTLDTVRYAFWRPVAEITHGIDYLFLSQWPWLMHVHGLLYFALLLFFSAKLYDEIHETRVSNSVLSLSSAPMWAFWAFALSYTHGLPAAWLANRNAILATLFVVLTLRAHHQWRSKGVRSAFPLALVFFVLGLLSGELAVSAGLYLFSYALFLDKGPLVRRLIAITPYAVVGVVWLGVRAAMEYGAKNSGHYIDPGQDFLLFLQVFGERALSLLSAQFFSLPPELLSAIPEQPKLIVQGILLLLLVVALVPIVKADSRARFWLFGALLCVLPVCATIPHSRLLMCVSLGAAGLLGLFFSHWRAGRASDQKQRSSKTSWLVMPVIMLLLASQYVLSPLLLPLEAASIRLSMDGALNIGARNLPITDLNNQRTAIVINPPMSSVAGYINGVRLFEDLPIAKNTIPLVSGGKDISLKVIDSHTIEIMAEHGLYDAHNEGLLRDPHQGFGASDQVNMRAMSVTVKKVNAEGVPLVAHFTFLHPLKSLSQENKNANDFYIWAGGALARCELPAKGGELRLNSKTKHCNS